MKHSSLLSILIATWLLPFGASSVNAAPENTVSTIADGEIYTFVARHSGKCLDVFDHRKDNGVHIQQWECTNEIHQSFRTLDRGQGTFALQNVNSGLCVDVADYKDENGARVQQLNCADTTNQRMRLVPSIDGSFNLRFAHSDKCLDVSGPSVENGAVVHQWDCVGQTNQEWYIRKSNAQVCQNGFRSVGGSCQPRNCGDATQIGTRYIRSIAPAVGRSGVVTKTFVCSAQTDSNGSNMNVFVEDDILDPFASESDIAKSYPSRCAPGTVFIVYSATPASFGTAFDGTCLNPAQYNVPLDLSEFNHNY